MHRSSFLLEVNFFFDLCYVALVVDTLTALVVFETLFLINVLQ